MEIIPAVLTRDPSVLDEELKLVRESKRFERVQIDFIDGGFTENLTLKPTEVDLIPYLPLKYDAHMMVAGDNSLLWGKVAEKMGFDRIFMQIEKVPDWKDWEYLAVDLPTPPEALKGSRWKSLKGVLVMAVNAGFGGQKFDPAVVEKVSYLDKLRQSKGLNFRICVDGGVEKEHLQILEEAGADEAAVGVKRVLEW